MPDFTELVTPWALKRLEKSGITGVQKINNVSFELDHECCTCWDYCYHDSGTTIEVYVQYVGTGPRGGKKANLGKTVCSSTVYSLDLLIQEMMEG